jgi:hypothetical protein
MTNLHPPEPPPSAAEAREAAAIRRRWITLGELLAVVAVAISGLTLWNSYSERSSTQAERAAAKSAERAKAQTLVLKATAERGGKRLTLGAVDEGQAIQSQTIIFPKPLKVAAVDTVIEPRIEADWLERPAKRARDAGKKDAASGDRRIPVGITTRFVSGGETFADTAIYDVGYKLEGGLLGDNDVVLRGLSRVERVDAGRVQSRLDALWASRQR